MKLSRAAFYYKPHPRDDRAERARILEIAETRVRYGMWRIHTLLRREGWLINHKKTHRIYIEEGLNLRRKRPRRRVAPAHREKAPAVSDLNECWSMDFVADELFNGRRIRALTVVRIPVYLIIDSGYLITDSEHRDHSSERSDGFLLGFPSS